MREGPGEVPRERGVHLVSTSHGYTPLVRRRGAQSIPEARVRASDAAVASHSRSVCAHARPTSGNYLDVSCTEIDTAAAVTEHDPQMDDSRLRRSGPTDVARGLRITSGAAGRSGCES